MPVGFPTKVNYATGDVLSATNMNDLSGTVNLLESAQYAAGKNKIINGDFGIWQRGTSFAMAGSGVYTADRWNVSYSGATGATVSQYVMTPQELLNFRFGLSLPGTLTDAVNGYILMRQPIEDVRTLSNQTITVSFYAKGSASGTIGIRLVQDFGTGGSPSSSVTITPQTQAITTSWTRYSLTFAIPSISGKTLGTNPNSILYVNIDKNIGTGNSLGYGTNPNYTGTLSYTGVQVEAGSTASPFQTATGTIQGELAACQRYYFRYSESSASSDWMIGFGSGTTTTAALGQVKHPVTMRVYPSAVDFSGLCIFDGVNSRITVTNLTLSERTKDVTNVAITVASGVTAFRPYFLSQNSNSTCDLGISSEL